MKMNLLPYNSSNLFGFIIIYKNYIITYWLLFIITLLIYNNNNNNNNKVLDNVKIIHYINKLYILLNGTKI